MSRPLIIHQELPMMMRAAHDSPLGRLRRLRAAGTRHLTGLVLCLAFPVAAQSPPSQHRHDIRGVVFDSVAGVPLGGAIVQVVAQNASGNPYTATTDAAGQYRVTDLPAGRFLIGFYHDALTVLGLDAPTQGVELASDSLVIVNLAIPSSRTIRTLRCGDSPFASSSGMLVGSVRNAERRTAVPGAVVRLSWRAFAFAVDNYRTVTERTTAQIEIDGTYLACQIPIDAPLDVEVTGPGHHTISGPLSPIPASGIGRFDIGLSDSTLTHGSAVVRGHVRHPSGKVVATGRALIPALGREVPIRHGDFILGDLPLGSWLVEARTIGHEPQRMLVNASDSVATLAELTIGDPRQHLDAVTIVGQRDANSQLLDEILRRKRIGMGTVFLPGSPALKSATFTSDVMRAARGFLYEGQNSISGRVIGSGKRCKFIAVYVDDMLLPDGFDGLDSVAPPSAVLAVETWPDIRLAPVQYRTGKFVLGTRDAYCAVVLVWTKNRLRW